MSTVNISKILLCQILSEMEGHARIIHARYDRKTKTWPWSDAIWKKSDPYRFGLFLRARRTLGPSRAQARR